MQPPKLWFIQQYLQKKINIQDFENITNINKDVNSTSVKVMLLNIVIFYIMEDHLIVIMHARLCHP